MSPACPLASVDRSAEGDDASFAPGQTGNMATHDNAAVLKPVSDDLGADRGTIEHGGPGRIWRTRCAALLAAAAHLQITRTNSPEQTVRAAIIALLLMCVLSMQGCGAKRFGDADLVGRWVINDPKSQAMLVLHEDRTVMFKSVNAQAIGLTAVDWHLELPPDGEWRFSSELNIVTFRIVINGVTYDHSAKVDLEEHRLYFSIGDPDMMERVIYKRDDTAGNW